MRRKYQHARHPTLSQLLLKPSLYQFSCLGVQGALRPSSISIVNIFSLNTLQKKSLRIYKKGGFSKFNESGGRWRGRRKGDEDGRVRGKWMKMEG